MEVCFSKDLFLRAGLVGVKQKWRHGQRIESWLWRLGVRWKEKGHREGNKAEKAPSTEQKGALAFPAGKEKYQLHQPC